MDHKMKYVLYLAFLILGFYLIGCSELQTNIEQPVEIGIHKDGVLNPSSTNFHGKLIKNNFWLMNECKSCHAADYTGGITDISCLTCHTGENGPEECNTCHGEFAKERNAPPQDVNGNTATTFAGVGAHTKHLYEFSIGARVRCSSCHTFPQSMYAQGHVDTDLPAEIIFGNIAIINVAGDANYDYSTNTCANTYCHGNFEFAKDTTEERNKFVYIADKMVGNNKTVKWTIVGQSESECGSCHGLPPAGHRIFELNECASCHPTVVDGAGTIIDSTKHINGLVDVWNE